MDKKQLGIQFRFKKNDSIGNAEAEADEAFLSNCFVDTGELDALRDFRDSKRILVGRTGSGKSALLRMLCEKEDNVIELKPDELALNFLSNSSVLRFFEDAGTQLDVFYQLLWKHVLAVELIRRKYKITNEPAQRSFLERFSGVFLRDKTKEQAISYLTQWGNSFWNETETRVREVTNKIEDDLRASIEGTAGAIKLQAGGAEKLTSEEKIDVVQRGSRAVSQVQLSALSNVLKLLEQEVFSDQQEGYFIVIDDLDTRWADDVLKFKLIRALIETIKSFRQVRQVKIVMALRLDLLQRVVTATRDSGFQSEKYESMYMRLRWSGAQLIDLVNRRLNHLVRQRYTSRAIELEELFPKKIHKDKFTDFLINRTSLRPRDAILFVNECLGRAADRQQVTAQMVIDAEASYSEKRIHSLQEEWQGVYPLASKYLTILERKPHSFPVSALSKSALEDWIITTFLSQNDQESKDPVVKISRIHFEEGKGSFFEVPLALLDALYAMGVVGVKPDSNSPTYWSFYSDHKPPSGSIKPASQISVHPTFWRAIGVNPA